MEIIIGSAVTSAVIFLCACVVYRRLRRLDYLERLDASLKKLDSDLSQQAETQVECLVAIDRRLKDDVPPAVARSLQEGIDAPATLEQALAEAGRTQAQLTVAMEKHTATVESIPESLSEVVSTQVARGLEPIRGSVDALRENLAESYGNMSTALENATVQLLSVTRHLTDQELLEDYVSRLAEASSSLAEMRRGLDSLFKDAAVAGETMGRLATCIEETQGQIGERLVELSKLNGLRGIDEGLFRKEIQDLFRTNLHKIEAEHQAFREVVDGFIQAVAEDSTIREALHENIPHTLARLQHASETMDTLVDKVGAMPEEYAEVVRRLEACAAENEKQVHRSFQDFARQANENHRGHQEALESSFSTFLDGQRQLLDESMKQMEAQSEKHQKAEADFLAGLAENAGQATAQLGEAVSKVSDALTERAGALGEAAEALDERIKQSADTYDRFIAEQQQLLDRLQDVVGRIVDAGFQPIRDSVTAHLNEQVPVIAGVKEAVDELKTVLGRVDQALESVRRTGSLAVANTILLGGILASLVALVVMKVMNL